MRNVSSALVLALAALGAGRAPAAPQPAPVSAVPPMAYTHRELANGLQVYAVRDTSTPNVAVQVWYKVGSKTTRRVGRASPTCSNT